jgi:hypothetical protein
MTGEGQRTNASKGYLPFLINASDIKEEVSTKCKTVRICYSSRPSTRVLPDFLIESATSKNHTEIALCSQSADN